MEAIVKTNFNFKGQQSHYVPFFHSKGMMYIASMATIL